MKTSAFVLFVSMLAVASFGLVGCADPESDVASDGADLTQSHDGVNISKDVPVGVGKLQGEEKMKLGAMTELGHGIAPIGVTAREGVALTPPLSEVMTKGQEP